MILSVRLYSDPLLNKVCQPIIDFQDESLEQLIQDLFETMGAYNGVGLAANQVGIDKAICVLDVEERTKKMVLINPTIVMYSKNKLIMPEGCLSCPGLTVQMKRPESLIIDANLLTGEKIRYNFTGYDAKIAGHEIDHLQGRTIATGIKSLNSML